MALTLAMIYSSVNVQATVSCDSSYFPKIIGSTLNSTNFSAIDISSEGEVSFREKSKVYIDHCGWLNLGFRYPRNFSRRLCKLFDHVQ